MAVMDEANLAGLIHDDLRGHSTQFENLDLLAVQFQHMMVGVRQTDKRQLFFLPVLLKRLCVFRPGDEDLRIQRNEFIIIPAQLRHVRAAERSDKTAVENQHHVLFVLIIGKRNAFSVEIIQRKIRRLNV